MSDFEFVQLAAAEAQQQLAQMAGMDAAAAGNALYNGKLYKGVFGHPQVIETMNPGGGWRKLTIIPLTITRDQFTDPAAPQSQTELTRVDLSPHATYRISKVDTNDPFIFALTLHVVGPKPER